MANNVHVILMRDANDNGRKKLKGIEGMKFNSENEVCDALGNNVCCVILKLSEFIKVMNSFDDSCDDHDLFNIFNYGILNKNDKVTSIEDLRFGYVEIDS